MIQKNITKKIFLLFIFLNFHNIFAATNLNLPIEIFDIYISNSFIYINSIDALQKNYYNFSLLSRKYNQKTKGFWKKNWFSIMENVCDEYRFERLYFAGIFYHVNDEIKRYYHNHNSLFKYAFYRNPYIQSLTPLRFGLGIQPQPNIIGITNINDMDPNFTTFGPNGQMSILECTIKAHSQYFQKIDICTYLIAKGAQYDIWIPGILKKEKELASFKSEFSFFLDTENNDILFLKKMRKPMLLSYFIAYHKDLTYDLAKLIVQKGTASQDHFIKRFPDLKIYKKKEISQPKIPHDFKIKNSFSLFRAYYLEFLIPGFFKSHFQNHLYQPLDYQKAYKNYDHFLHDQDEKKMLDYVKKQLKNSDFENKRLKIITILKHHSKLQLIFKTFRILPKRIKYFLIEFAASQSKAKILILIFPIIILISIMQCIKALLNSNKINFFSHLMSIILLLLFSNYFQLKKIFYSLKSKDTLYDPYYFVYL